MRLIARRVYRAFPELDQFSDLQCERFVRAVNGRWKRRHLRFWLLLTPAVLTLLGSFTFFEWVLYRRDGGWFALRRFHPLFIDFLNIALPFILTGLVGLLARDIVIRLQIRRVIRTRGTCAGCGYSLLGIRVGQGGMVTCPECGTSVEADESLGELATDALGGRVFQPIRHEESLARQTLWRKRRRKAYRWLLVMTGSAFALASITLGAWWLWIDRQSARAASTRSLGTTIQAWQAARRPKDAGTQPQDAWAALMAARQKFTKVNAEFVGTGMPSPPWFQSMYSRSTSQGWAMTPPPPGFEEPIAKTYALHEERHTLRAFAELGHHTYFERDLAPPQTLAQTGLWTMDLNDLMCAATLATARLDRAMQAHDQDKVQECLAAWRVLRSALDQDCTLWGHSMAARMRHEVAEVTSTNAFRIDDPGLLRAILNTLPDAQTMIPLSERLQFQKDMAIDTVRLFYSDPAQVRQAYLGGVDYVLMGPGMRAMGQPMTPTLTWIPPLETAERELGQKYDALILATRAPVDEWMDVTSFYTLVNSPSHLGMLANQNYIIHVVREEVEAVRATRLARLALAVELRAREAGAYPQSLRDLLGTQVTEEDLQDPLTKTPFEYSPQGPADVGPTSTSVR